MVSVIVLSFVVVGRRTTSDYEDARWPPARPHAASYTTEWGTTLAQAGELKPIIDRTYQLESAAEAHAYVETGRKRGNVVLEIRRGV